MPRRRFEAGAEYICWHEGIRVCVRLLRVSRGRWIGVSGSAGLRLCFDPEEIDDYQEVVLPNGSVIKKHWMSFTHKVFHLEDRVKVRREIPKAIERLDESLSLFRPKEGE